jgi:hypothetical protein
VLPRLRKAGFVMRKAHRRPSGDLTQASWKSSTPNRSRNMRAGRDTRQNFASGHPGELGNVQFEACDHLQSPLGATAIRALIR